MPAWRTTDWVGITTANCVFNTNDNKGIGWLNNETGRIYYANRANGLLHRDTINAFTESAEGKFYLVSENGVQVSDTGHRKFEWIGFNTQVKNEKPFGMANANWERFSIVCLPGNRLALGEKNNIILLDIEKKTSKVITTPLPANSQVYSENSKFRVDSRGQVYFINSGRIFRLTENGELKLLWENTSEPTLRITAFFIDRSDVLWVSVNAQGLLKIDLQASLFHSYEYRAGFVIDILELTGY